MELTLGQKHIKERYLAGENVLALWGRRTGKSTVARSIIEELDEKVTVIVPHHRMAMNYRRDYKNLQVLTPTLDYVTQKPVIKNKHVIVDEHMTHIPPYMSWELDDKIVLVLSTPMPRTKMSFYEVVPMDFVSRLKSPQEHIDEFVELVPDKHFRREFLALLDGEENIWESEENTS